MSRLDASYDRCRRINRSHGRSFATATLLLPAGERRHVHALYALARTADDLVDGDAATDRATSLADFERRFFSALGAGGSDDLILAAVVDTIVVLDLDPGLFERFFHSMRMDLTVTSYDTWDDLVGYMDGSAAVIGEMMLPVLHPTDPSAAVAPARSLGFAFQLTNMLRDIDADLALGRRYLPDDDLHRFGVDLAARRVTPEFVDLMRFEIERCRALYRDAEAGFELLPPRSARCIRVARHLYGRILDEIERADYDVFAQRATVPPQRRLRGVAAGLRSR